MIATFKQVNSAIELSEEISPEVLKHAKTLFAEQQYDIHRQADRLFGLLLIFQYILGIILALTVTPKSWIGETSSTHLHVWIAIIFEAIVISLPLYLIFTKPAQPVTRHTVAVAQVLTSAVLIHLTGGRIETHFHIFGSLAFLAFYQDWRVLLTATMVVAADHFFRGIYWPLSIYGVTSESEWRWVEHAAWVVFEDVFLLYSCRKNIQKMWQIAYKQAELGDLTQKLGVEVEQRKQSEDRLQKAQRELKGELTDQTIELAQMIMTLEKELAERKRLESQLVQSQKMESLGQLAAGVAHEINNPIGFVMSNLRTLGNYVNVFKELFSGYQQVAHKLQSQPQDVSEEISKMDAFIQKEDIPFIITDIDALLDESQEGTQRVQEIVKNLKSFARLDESVYKQSSLHDCLEATMKIASNELKYKCNVIKNFGDIPNIYCNPGQLNQVFLNLLVNAAQAIDEQGDITVETLANENEITVRITDTGSGIPKDKLDKIFDPFYTTKPVGKGTGLGLAISYGIIQSHGGTIDVDSEPGQGTCFTIRLPITSEKSHPRMLEDKVPSS